MQHSSALNLPLFSKKVPKRGYVVRSLRPNSESAWFHKTDFTPGIGLKLGHLSVLNLVPLYLYVVVVLGVEVDLWDELKGGTDGLDQEIVDGNFDS